MTNEERNEYVKYRIESAYKTFGAASHSATKSQFSQLFIKTGKFDKKYGRLLSELFDQRQKGDYDHESVKPLFEPVAEMIDLIEKEINNALQYFIYLTVCN